MTSLMLRFVWIISKSLLQAMSSYILTVTISESQPPNCVIPILKLLIKI